MSSINLLVFDGNSDFQASLEHYTLSLPGIHYRAVASDVAAALDTFSNWEPDIILCATEFFKGLGDDQFDAMRGKWPNALCYRLTVFDESVYEEFATGKGFDGSASRAEIEEHLGRIIARVQEARKETL